MTFVRLEKHRLVWWLETCGKRVVMLFCFYLNQFRGVQLVQAYLTAQDEMFTGQTSVSIDARHSNPRQCQAPHCSWYCIVKCCCVHVKRLSFGGCRMETVQKRAVDCSCNYPTDARYNLLKRIRQYWIEICCGVSGQGVMKSCELINIYTWTKQVQVGKFLHTYFVRFTQLISSRPHWMA